MNVFSWNFNSVTPFCFPFFWEHNIIIWWDFRVMLIIFSVKWSHWQVTNIPQKHQMPGLKGNSAYKQKCILLVFTHWYSYSTQVIQFQYNCLSFRRVTVKYNAIHWDWLNQSATQVQSSHPPHHWSCLRCRWLDSLSPRCPLPPFEAGDFYPCGCVWVLLGS